MAERPLWHYYAAVSAALRAKDTEVVPGLLIRMALDGYGHEAEELRRQMLTVMSADKAARGEG